MKKTYKNSFLISELSKTEQDFNFAKYQILPIPLEKTVSYGKGTSKGPIAILKASNELERIYGGNEPCLKGIYTHDPINCMGNMDETLKEIQNIVKDICKNKKIPVAIGGEHTLTYGMVKGIRRGLDICNSDIGIIQFDAHADLRKKFSNQKFSHASVMYELAQEGFKIFQFGVRAISQEEIKTREELGINFFDFNSFDFKRSIYELSLPKSFPKYLYLSFDSDALDPSIMPATGTPVPKGLSYENALIAISNLIKKRNVIGLDYVEFSPINNIKAYDFISASLIYEIMGLIEVNSHEE